MAFSLSSITFKITLYNNLFHFFFLNEGSSFSTKCHGKKKLKKVDTIDSENSSGCKKNDYSQEANALMYSNPGSICNLHEIEEDERRMSINAIRSELQIGLRKTYKKQKKLLKHTEDKEPK